VINDNEPLVTVGITNFNYGKFVLQTIDSILTQSYPNIEVLVYDDCSTDNSVQKIKHRYCERVTLLLPKKNSGQGFGVNWIIRAAQGRYVVIIDGDDMLHDQAIDKLVEAIGDYDVAFGYCSSFSDDPNYEVDRHSYINSEVDKLKSSGSIITMAQLMPRCNKLISLSYARNCGLKNSDYRVMDDALFAMTLAMGRPKCIYTNILITAIRVHTSSTSNVKNEQQIKEIMGATIELYEHLKEQDMQTLFRLAGNNLLYFILYSSENTSLVLKNRSMLKFSLRAILAVKLLAHARLREALKLIT